MAFLSCSCIVILSCYELINDWLIWFWFDPQHAAESPATGTFIVGIYDAQMDAQRQQWRVSEVNTGGQILRQFSGSDLLPLGLTEHIAVDSQGNVLVADCQNSRISLLSAKLQLRRVILDVEQLIEERRKERPERLNESSPPKLDDMEPRRLCLVERSGQLLVASRNSVTLFDVLRDSSKD